MTNREALIVMGFRADVAEALDERGITAAEAYTMPRERLMDEYLQWEGIFGYASALAHIAQHGFGPPPAGHSAEDGK